MGWVRPGAGLVAAVALCGMAQGQVFVVGVKTAEASAVTEFQPTRVTLPTDPLNERDRLGLIRGLEAEGGFAHRELPMGAGLMLIANGNMTPRDDAYKKMLYEKGQAAGPGDRVQITALKFERDSIVIDFNGGPYAKHRFLSHVQLNDVQLAQLGPVATGCRVTLAFEGGIPDVTPEEVKDLLRPIIDFHAKTSEEAYADTLPPVVRQAVADHQVLVGMNERMVLAAMGEPGTRHREHSVAGDLMSPVWEEWIYGTPPETTQFVRFEQGRVVRLEIAAVGKPLEVHDRNDVDPAEALHAVLETRTIANGDTQPDPEGRHAKTLPTLLAPGEKTEGTKTAGKVNLPPDAANQLAASR